METHEMKIFLTLTVYGFNLWSRMHSLLSQMCLPDDTTRRADCCYRRMVYCMIRNEILPISHL